MFIKSLILEVFRCLIVRFSVHNIWYFFRAKGSFKNLQGMIGRSCVTKKSRILVQRANLIDPLLNKMHTDPQSQILLVLSRYMYL